VKDETNLQITIAAVRADHPGVNDVIRLADQNCGRLGFVPAEALRRAAGQRKILVAIGAENQVLGYVWYSVTQSTAEARIHHLCVASDHRKGGVGRRLVDAIKHCTMNLRGIVLHCRRDYEDSSRFWRSVGFVPLAEIRGRGRDETRLTCFRFDHGHADLWTDHRAHLAQTKAVAVLDANVFFDLAGESSSTHNESQALRADWVAEYAVLWIADELYAEIDRHSDPIRRHKHRDFARGFHRLSATVPENDAALSVLEQILPTARSESDQSDRRHLATAVAGGAHFFISRDRVLLQHAPQIAERYGLSVVSPLEFILSIDELQHGWHYQPARLAGSGLAIQMISGKDVRTLSDEFLNYGDGETKAEFERRLRTQLADVGNTRGYIVRDGTRSLALMVLSRRPDSAMEIAFLRVRPYPLGPTLACHLACKAIQIAVGDAAPVTILSDVRCQDFVRTTCGELGFVVAGDHLAKISLQGLFAPDAILQKIEDLHTTQPKLKAETEPIADAVSRYHLPDCSAAELARVEKLLWPMKLDTERLPAYMVPIQAKWATHLFDENLAAQELFSVDTFLSLQHENVYYRAARQRIVTAPGRILWYISETRDYDGTAQIRACSRVEEVVVAPAHTLFKRFSRLGVFGWRDVLSTARNKPNADIMAIRFAGTELLSCPVPRGEVRRVLSEEREGKTPQFTTALELSHREFARLYVLGQGITTGGSA